jgi:two-component system, OmpR family, KDP operon response regulator KdpE
VARILLIDDDAALLRALRIGLSSRGYDVVEARSGEEGITQASLSGPDVVVLDLGLPDLDGIEVCRRIRTWTQVPIIVLSATGSENRKVAALDS